MKKVNLLNTRGITTISLVVTIIILVILAGIAISALTKSSIIDKAVKSANLTNLEAIKENIYAEIFKELEEDGKIDKVKLNNLVSQYGTLNEQNILETKYGQIDFGEMVKNADHQYLELDISKIEKGKEFSIYNSRFNPQKETIYAKMDISKLGNGPQFQNILSFGENINDFYSNKGEKTTVHFYYPSDDGKLIIAFIKGKIACQYKYAIYNQEELEDLTIAFNSNGLFINNENVYSSEKVSKRMVLYKELEKSSSNEWRKNFFNDINGKTLNIEIGSKEGNTRSNADYESIRIYSKLLDENDLNDSKINMKEEVLGLSSIKKNEQFSVWKDQINLSRAKIYAEIDVSNIDKSINLQNILSIGTDIQNWQGSSDIKANLHFYYNETEESRQLYIATIANDTEQCQVIYDLEPDTNIIKIEFDAYGLLINGNLVMSDIGITDFVKFYQGSVNNVRTFFKKLVYADANLEIGSKEGNNRSTADYKKISIYREK